MSEQGWMGHLEGQLGLLKKRLVVRLDVHVERSQLVAPLADLVLWDAQASLLGWSEDMSDDALEASFECLALARAQVRESAGIPYDGLDVAVNPKR